MQGHQARHLVYSMQKLVTALFFLVLVGCASSTDQIDAVSELENVSRCFHAAHTLLQEGPETLGTFPKFLEEARVRAETSDEVPEDANFSKLNFSDNGASLETSDGQQIRCRVVEEQQDNFGQSGSAFWTTYEFYIPNTQSSARTTVELRIP